MALIVCETVAAIVTHLRETSREAEINYAGFAKRPKTLCGVNAAWDTKLPVGSTRCSECRIKAMQLFDKEE